MIKSIKQDFKKFSALLSDPKLQNMRDRMETMLFRESENKRQVFQKKGLTTTFELRNYFKEKGDLSMQLFVQGYLQQRKRLNPKFFPI